MSKKIGTITINKETLQGLKGFEDVFEDYVESEEYKEIERREQENSKIGEQYELQSFLEQEKARLTCLDVFLSKKISLKMNFSQTDKFILVQTERKQILTEKLSTEFNNNDSHFFKNLAQFFNSHFS